MAAARRLENGELRRSDPFDCEGRDAEADSEAGLARQREVRATMARTIPPHKYVIREADSLPFCSIIL